MLYNSQKITFFIVIFIFSIGILYAFLPNFSVEELSVTYPFDGTLFPPDIASPTVIWTDETGADTWTLRIEFQDTNDPLEAQTTLMKWTPERDMWESIKKRSLEKTANVTIHGFKKRFGLKKIMSKKEFSITTSGDEVGAPIFFRSVTLPFEYAVKNMNTIKWCLGDISSEKPPRVVLENMPVCGNCHSFSADGKVLGMDVDYANDKGSYIISDISENIMLTGEKVITWSDYRREDRELTYGLLSQVSPSGDFAVSTVKDRSVFVPVDDRYYSQLFFPIRGILAYYDRKTKSYHALHGADDRRYVQSNPSWSPDGKYIVFAKSKVGVLENDDNRVVLAQDRCRDYLTGKKKFKFDLYRIPFNDGKGGEAKPIEGASNNGMSNYFAKYSPDGKWIVFCKAESFMLLQPDSKLYIMPAGGGTPREMKCNTDQMNSWHSWSPNSRWLVFSSKIFTPYTQLFLTHIDEDGNDSPPVLMSRFTPPDRAANIPEFVNIKPGGIKQIHKSFVNYYSYCRLGEHFMALERYDEAEKSYRKSIELNPYFALAHRKLGSLLAAMNRINEAVKEWEIALRIDPEDPLIHMNMGTFYLNRNEYGKAQKAFDKSIEFDPNCAPAHTGLGVILLLKGDIERAQIEFEKAIKADSDIAEAHYELGIIFIKKKDYDKAEKAFETALKIDPDNLRALHNLGFVYMNKKEYKKAEKAFRTMYRADPDNPNICYMLGKVLSMNDETISEAISMYKKSISLMPSNIDGYINLGNLYLRGGDKAKALHEFEKAYKIDPYSPSLRMYVNQLKRKR